MKPVNFYYFSGTGNTLLVVKEMAKVFFERGVKVNLRKIEKSEPQNADLTGTVGLAFPVAAQSTYPFVWDFINNLPDANGTEIFMVDTVARFSGAIIGPLKRVLLKKGYNPIGAKEIIMPCNFFVMISGKEKTGPQVGRGLEKARKFAADLVEGRARWGRVPILSDIFYFFMSRKCVWKCLAKLGKKFTVNEEKCTKCGLCEKLCPVANIKMEEYPMFLGHCQQCMRCISFCPVEAIYVPKWKYGLYRAVKAEELI